MARNPFDKSQRSHNKNNLREYSYTTSYRGKDESLLNTFRPSTPFPVL